MAPRVTVWARTSFVGFHAWPQASKFTTNRGYLEAQHRHRFGVRADLLVGHDDRDVEFHDLLEQVNRWVDRWPNRPGGGKDLGARSCEHLAIDLGEHLDRVWPGLVAEVTVTEDDECGGTVRWN